MLQCPVDGGDSPPSFVGANYKCDAANTSTSWDSIWYGAPLFTGSQIISIGFSISEDLEGRQMSDQESINEDIGVAELLFFVR